MRLAFATLALACLLAPAAALAGIPVPVPVQIPEPGTLAMFAAGIGGAAIVLRLWRRK